MSKISILKPFLDDEIINSFSVDFQYIRDKNKKYFTQMERMVYYLEYSYSFIIRSPSIY